MQLKEFHQARSFLKQCLKAHPRFPQGWLLKAMLEEQSGELEQAIKGFSSYLELSGPNKQIERHLLELVLKQKAAQKNSNTIVLNRPCFEKALMLFEKKQYRAALQHINSCLSHNESDPQMRLLKMQILTAMKEFDKAIKLLVAWSANEPNNVMWPQVLHLLSRAQAPVEKIITAFTALHSQNPRNLAFALYLADLHTRAGNDAKALGYHRIALPLTNDSRIKARVLFQIAALEYERENYSKMLAALTEVEKLQPHFAPAYNLHAYYLATEGNNIEKAQAYFEKAYALDKGNPHILDTQGVILYKQKKYKQALALLQPLAKKMPEDGSVLIHLAKTYAKMGNHTQARTTIDLARKHARTPYEQKTAKSLHAQWSART